MDYITARNILGRGNFFMVSLLSKSLQPHLIYA